jgi:hypothetical protein
MLSVYDVHIVMYNVSIGEWMGPAEYNCCEVKSNSKRIMFHTTYILQFNTPAIKTFLQNLKVEPNGQIATC